MAMRSVFVLVLLASCARADDRDAIAKAKKDLLPRSVTLKSEKMPLADALSRLAAQTGNHVADRRQTKSDVKLNLALDNSTFWPALEAIAKQAGCGISTYQPDGHVALVDAPVRSARTLHQGIFRITAKRIAIARDDEAGTHVCTISLDIAWEPRYEPLYLEVGAIQATFSADAKGVERQVKLPGQGRISVAGRNAIEVDIRLPAPERSSAKLKALEGEFRLIGPGQMLTFTFPSLKTVKKGDPPLQQTQDGVQVSLVEVKTSSSRWSVAVLIVNPKENPRFESYESWLGNNQISLEKGTGPDRAVWTPRAGEEQVRESGTRADIVYSFPIPPKQNKGETTDWTLVYRTPGPIVITAVPFTFKDVALP
jgi:hypothetical protein